MVRPSGGLRTHGSFGLAAPEAACCLAPHRQGAHVDNNLLRCLAVCDPVMGDDGRLYVPKDLLPAYRSHIVAEANVLTPNQFEAELLTDIQIGSRSQAINACNALHAMGPQTVVRCP